MADKISQEFLDQIADIAFADAAAIHAFFANAGTGATFIKWFNNNCAEIDAWKTKRIPDTTDCARRFATFWDGAADVFGAAPNVVQFICLMSIFINEVGGDLVPIEERVGRTGHPGIAYAFDAIPGLKKSYNTLDGNVTAFDLFRDADYRAAHAGKALADRFPTPASVSHDWAGEVWPAGFPTSTDPMQTGFLLEADFYKFRGRGLIQTTGRANYGKLIDFVQAYAGSDPVLGLFAARWSGKGNDLIASTSSNADWTQLFMSDTLEMARAAIRLHNAGSGDYLDLAFDDADQLNGEGSGSVHRMGRRISGSSNYAETFRSRVAQICTTLEGVQVGV